MAKIANGQPRLNTPQPDFSASLSTTTATPSPGVPLNINRHQRTLNVPPPKTGVDKLTLTTRDFLLSDVTASRLRAVTSTDYSTGQASAHLLTDQSGHAVTADRLYDNNGLASIDINRHGLRVTFNPSKLVTPSAGGLLCTSPVDLTAAVNLVKRDLRDRGILCDLDDARLYRLDLTRDADLRGAVAQYTPVFGALGLKRARNQSLYPGGLQSTHGTLGLVMYNKGAEAGLQRDNLLRGELQFKRHDGAPLKRSGVYSIRSLFNVGFDGLHDLYAATMRANVFTSASITDTPATLDRDLVTELTTLRNMYGARGYVQKWLAQHGVANVLEFYSQDQIAEALRGLGMTDRHIRRVKLEMTQLLHVGRNSHTTGHLANLYGELLANFAA